MELVGDVDSSNRATAVTPWARKARRARVDATGRFRGEVGNDRIKTTRKTNQPDIDDMRNWE